MPKFHVAEIIDIAFAYAEYGDAFFTAVAPVLEALHRTPKILTMIQEIDIKVALSKLPYAGISDYDKLIKLWGTSVDPKVMFRSATSLFRANKIVAAKDEKAIEKSFQPKP
ncbi:MAG: hypothetical protein ACYCQI_12340 [Gammaproteobacteria bacterium]